MRKTLFILGIVLLAFVASKKDCASGNCALSADCSSLKDDGVGCWDSTKHIELPPHPKINIPYPDVPAPRFPKNQRPRNEDIHENISACNWEDHLEAASNNATNSALNQVIADSQKQTEQISIKNEDNNKVNNSTENLKKITNKTENDCEQANCFACDHKAAISNHENLDVLALDIKAHACENCHDKEIKTKNKLMEDIKSCEEINECESSVKDADGCHKASNNVFRRKKEQKKNYKEKCGDFREDRLHKLNKFGKNKCDHQADAHVDNCLHANVNSNAKKFLVAKADTNQNFQNNACTDVDQNQSSFAGYNASLNKKTLNNKDTIATDCRDNSVKANNKQSAYASQLDRKTEIQQAPKGGDCFSNAGGNYNGGNTNGGNYNGGRYSGKGKGGDDWDSCHDWNDDDSCHSCGKLDKSEGCGCH